MSDSVGRLRQVLDEGLAGQFGSAVSAILAIDGEVVFSHYAGSTQSWADLSTQSDAGEPITPATRYDLASLTKPVVAAAVLTELEQRGIDTQAPVARVVPAFPLAAVAPELSFAHLLSHTAGFAAEWFDRDPDPRKERFIAGSRPEAIPGSRHQYSCVGYLWAGIAIEQLTGVPLDQLLQRHVFDPLQMTETSYLPGPDLPVAATEWQPGVGMVQGFVHDETARAMGGVCGNSGLFGTARDLLRFAEAVRLADGLEPAVVRQLVTPVALAKDPDYEQCLGFRKAEAWTRPLGSQTVSHTGFTGAALATQLHGRRSLVLLANRIHPSRVTPDINQWRLAVTTAAMEVGEPNDRH